VTDVHERTYTWNEPALPEAAAGRTGLELLRAIAAGELPAAPVMRTLAFDIESVEAGRVAFRLRPDGFHYNPIGSVHGGVVATLLDSAAGCAVHSTLPAGVGYTSVDLSVKFLRALTVETGEVRATGWVVHPGRTIALARAELADGGGRLLAEATSSCLILRS
jgi:uncharacterized protein (TIGR00369 family)